MFEFNTPSAIHVNGDYFLRHDAIKKVDPQKSYIWSQPGTELDPTRYV
jgi:hypothetical protein